MTIAEAASPRRPPPPNAPLKGIDALILDCDAATAALLRTALEAAGASSVEVAATREEALDLLGNAHRPIRLAMLDTLTDGGACVPVLEVLVTHRAHIAVTLHGRRAPEAYAVPQGLVGAAAYTHLATSGEAVRKAAEVLVRGLDVAEIVTSRIVPVSLDPAAGFAIYGAAPGDRFPINLRV